MAAGFLGGFYDLLVRGARIPELDVVFYRIAEQIHVLEYETEVFHQAVHAVILHAAATQSHRACVYIPEAREQVAKRRLARTARAHDGRSRLFGNGKRHVVNDFALVVGKIDTVGLDVVIGGGNVFAIDVHGGLVQDIVCAVDRNVDGTEECRVATAQLQGRKEHKGAH